MKILSIAAFTLAAALSAAPVSAAQRELVPAGEPVNCIQTNVVRSTNVVDDRTIDFEMGGNRVFRNSLPNSCPGLNSSRAFAYSPTGNQLCSVDTITVIQQAGGPVRGATCGLGQFTPMERKPAAK